MTSHFYGWVSLPCYRIMIYMYDFTFLFRMGQFFYAMELRRTCMISHFYGWVSFSCHGIVTYMYDFMCLGIGQFAMLWNCDLHV